MATLYKSIIGFDSSPIVPIVTLLIIWCVAGFDLAISAAILFLSLLAVWWMFTDSPTASAEFKPAPVEPSLPTRRLKKKPRKVVTDEVMKSTGAGMEPAPCAETPQKIDRSVGTDDLYEIPIARQQKELSRAARRRRHRKERVAAVVKETREETKATVAPVEATCKEPSEVAVHTPSTEVESRSDDASPEKSQESWPAAVDSERPYEMVDELVTEVTQEVSQGPPTPKRGYASVSHTSSTSASYNARRINDNPPVLPPPFPPPEYRSVPYVPSHCQQRQQSMGYYATPPWFAPLPLVRFVPFLPPGLSTPYEPALARRVRWVEADEIRIEMAGVWAGSQGKWRAIAMSHWLKWLMSYHLPSHSEDAFKPLLDLDLSRNDLTDEEFKWMMVELEQRASIVRLRVSHNQLTELCVDTLLKLFNSPKRHPVMELHLNGNLLGGEGASALLTTVEKMLSERDATDGSQKTHPLWLRLDDNAVDNENDILEVAFDRPGQYCLALPGSPCTLEACANGSLVHLFNFAKLPDDNCMVNLAI